MIIDKNFLISVAGISVAVMIAIFLERIIGNVWLPWFIGGALMAISSGTTWIPKEKRTFPRIIMLMLLTGITASIGASIITLAFDKYIFPG
ncbi:MAG: hypothetical protein AB1746_16525 [Candidatus Zixiibacteriota bacterium]